jgi:glycosyltransferase involved in cell wall biosynthesis
MPIIAVIWTVCNSDFDVVITSSGSSPLVWFPGLLAKLLFKKPWIVDVRDLLVDGAISLGFLESESLLTCLLRKFEFNCYLHSDFVLVTSNSARKGVLSYDIPEDRVVLIPNGADTEIFYPRCISKKRQVIYAGNIGYAQDFDCVILAMKEVANHNVHLIIVGEGEVKERLRDLVSANHLDKYVTFLDALERSKLPTLLSESIAGLAPLKKIDTIAGSIPAKVFDYMACAIPFVAFGGSDLRQIAEKSGSGFVVDNDPDALAKTIIYIAENPKLGEEMGQRGLEYCEKYYNRRLMAAKIKSLIFKLYDTRICNGHVANSQTERRLL